jgi:hypothetical protein
MLIFSLLTKRRENIRFVCIIILGQSVFQTTVNAASGIFIYSLDLLQQLSSGYYQIEIISESGCTMQKIMIQQ